MDAMEPKRILIIEDDAHIAEGLKLNLTLKGYEAIVAGDGIAGLRLWEESRPDLIVLDIMLPRLDGLSVLQAIRLKEEKLPILILSAKNAPDDRIQGLIFGVDDYLCKPFDLAEFLLRVDRLIKRASWSREGGPTASSDLARFSFGGNRIDFEIGTAECRQGKIVLTEQETKLLKLFIANPGRPLSRDKLLEIGWGYSRKISSRTVDNFMVRLRRYFEEDPKNPKHFKSLRSVGYVFDPVPNHAP